MLIIEGDTTPPVASLAVDDKRLLQLLLTELPPARAARVAAEFTGKPRSAFYQMALDAKEGGAA